MDEMLEIIRRFWTEDDVEFHGEFFDFEPAGITPKPPEPVPVWIGGKSPAALARAARHEGWLGMNYDLPEVYELLAALNDARAAREVESGVRSSDFETFVIPNAAPSSELYADLASRGVTSTIGSAWPYADRDYASIEAKRDAIARFAEGFL
jgi:alkanesulfonate monooxygenase SsuD/methylene tetrahydromethanopterin reductase-like flavin-dependent oxidoreductase (luciferase family)